MFTSRYPVVAKVLAFLPTLLGIACLAVLCICFLRSEWRDTCLANRLQAWSNKLRSDIAFFRGRSVHLIHTLHSAQGNIVSLGSKRVFSNTIDGFQSIYGTSSKYGGVFPKAKWYARMSGKPDIFTDRDVARHGRARKLLSPAFNMRNVTECEPTMQYHAERFVSAIRRSSGKSIEVGHLIHCFMADVMFDVNIGKRLSCIETNKPVGWTAQLSRVFYWATVKDLLDGTGIPALLKWTLHPIFVREARRFKSEAAETIQAQLYDSGKSNGILSKVLEREDAAAWTEDELLPHIRSVLFASVHSTTTALTATLQFILSHPMTHLRLLKELRMAFGHAERVALGPLPDLPYLNAVIDESLRLFPPIPLLGPRVSPGYTIDGRYVESGNELYTSLYSLHRNPEYFPEPHSFIPERWLDGEVGPQRAAFHPFSTGSRSCIGKHLALQVLRLSLARLLLEFDGECDKDIARWTTESKCYAVWEVPKLWVQFTSLPKEDDVVVSDSSISSL